MARSRCARPSRRSIAACRCRLPMASLSRSRPTTVWFRRRIGVKASSLSMSVASRTSRANKGDRQMREKAHVREVGPRDGIQMVKSILPSARKLAWCRGTVEAGIREIEVTSFVPAKVIPQFADAEEVARGALEMPGLRPSVLVPNLKGAERAFALGVPMVNYVLSASEEHNQANVRRSTEESLADFARIVAARDARSGPRIGLGAGIATA